MLFVVCMCSGDKAGQSRPKATSAVIWGWSSFIAKWLTLLRVQKLTSCRKMWKTCYMYDNICVYISHWQHMWYYMCTDYKWGWAKWLQCHITVSGEDIRYMMMYSKRLQTYTLAILVSLCVAWVPTRDWRCRPTMLIVILMLFFTDDMTSGVSGVPTLPAAKLCHIFGWC